MAAADVHSFDEMGDRLDAADTSAIARDMAALADAIAREDSVSASIISEIASYLNDSRLWSTTSSNGKVSTTMSSLLEKQRRGFDGQANTARFKILKLLGHGGFGVVLLAYDRRLRREVALKIPKPELLSSSIGKRFLREAQTAASLDHPNIVPIYDTGEIGSVWFITSRYVAGPNLATWLKDRETSLPSSAIARLVAQLADAVHYAHTRGVLHRDLKPANILLDAAEIVEIDLFPFVPKLSDFGLALDLRGVDQNRRMERCGTPRYMAPEQVDGRSRDIGMHTDVYGLGTILYEILFAQTPIASAGSNAIPRIRNGASATQEHLLPQAPADLRAICLKCLHENQFDRYASAHDLANDLRRFINGEPTVARPVRIPTRLGLWCRRKPYYALLCALLALVFCSGATGVLFQWRRAENNLALAETQAVRAESNLRQMESAFIDLAWIFEEAELWSRTDTNFPLLLRGRLRQYADSMKSQYDSSMPVSSAVRAALCTLEAKCQSLEGNRDADSSYRKAVGLWFDLIHTNPDEPEYHRAFGLTLYSYASHITSSRPSQAGDNAFTHAQEMFAKLNLAPGDDLFAREQYAQMMTNLGYARAGRGRGPEAMLAFDLASMLWGDLATRSSKQGHLIAQSSVLRALAWQQRRVSHDLAGALVSCQRATASANRAVDMAPFDQDALLELAMALADEATFTNRNQRPSRAVVIYQRSVSTFEEWLQNNPESFAQMEEFGAVCHSLARILLDTQGQRAALPYYKKGIDVWASLRKQGHLSKRRHGGLAIAYLRLGEIYSYLGQDGDAIAAYRTCIEIALPLREDPASERKVTTALVDSLIELGDLLEQRNEFKEADDRRRQVLAILDVLSQNRPENIKLRRQLNDQKQKLAASAQSD